MPPLAQCAVSVDISYYQVPINGLYIHDVFICRHSDGDFKDPNFDVNWARATADPRIRVVVAYHVYRPAGDVVQARRADRVRADTRGIGCAMIDAETWGGAIGGNQSAGLNLLWQLLVARYANNPRRAWGYANRGDWASMWPQRPGSMPMVVASYGPNMPTWAANMLGWQYTDGEAKYGAPAGLPFASAPFGNCDHNVFPAFRSGSELAAWIGGVTEEDELSQVDSDNIAWLRARIEGITPNSGFTMDAKGVAHPVPNGPDIPVNMLLTSLDGNYLVQLLERLGESLGRIEAKLGSTPPKS